MARARVTPPGWAPGAQLHPLEESSPDPGSGEFFDLVHPSGIEGLIFGSWATLSGERLSCVGTAEGPGHGGVEISDELLILVFNICLLAKLPRRISFRTRMENQISI